MRRAFSLIETLVVVSILAIIATIAIPSYSQYRAKVKIANAFSSLGVCADSIINTYNKTGVLPLNPVCFGTTLSWVFNASTVVNVGNIYRISYTPDGNLGFTLWADLKGLSGVSGYVEAATATTAPVNGSIRYSVRQVNGVMKPACGNQATSAGPGGYDVPTAYLPGGCSCTVTHNYAYGTGSC
jgi:prepilin-type N-terminal cleavage/methylation domain-containing protein